MYVVNEDNSIYVTRGDIVAISLTADDNGENYKFKAGDVVRIKVFGKKDCENVVLQKDFPIAAETETVEIYLDENDTKIGGVISKPVDYWYEVELNPESDPQTIIGYDEDGARVFKLFPEGRDLSENDPIIAPEDITIVDTDLSLTSKRPVENRAVARAVEQLKASITKTNANLAGKSDKLATSISQVENALGVERARIDNFVALEEGSTTGDAELKDGRIGYDGNEWANLGNNIRANGKMGELISKSVRFRTEKIETRIINGWVDKNGIYASNASSGDLHKCVQIDVNAGEQYLIYSEYGWSMPDAVAQKADGTMVRYFNTAESKAINDFDKIITIPDGAEKLTVNCMYYNAKPLTVAKIIGCESKVTEEYVANAIAPIKYGKRILSDNMIKSVKTAYGLKFGVEFAVESGDTQFSVGECAVEQGKTYYIEAGASFLSNPYIFYDESGLIVGEMPTAPEGDYQLYNLEIVAPSDAVLLKVGQYGGVLPKVYEVVGYEGDKEWKDIKWVCVGDSLTEENIRTTKHYFDYIAEKTGISVVNMGVGGTGYKRGEDREVAFYQRIEDVPADADVVTIFGSGNDVSILSSLGKITDTGTDTICGCINTTINRLYEINPAFQIGIIAPTPWVYHQPNNNSGMAVYVNAMKDICELQGIPFLDLFHCSGFRPNDEKYRNLVFSKDEGNGVHPNELGHKIISRRVKAFLDTLII